MTDKKDTWCVLPWVHTCVSIDNKISPCCRWAGITNEDTLTLDKVEEYGISSLNSDYLKQLRSDMINGISRTDCKDCYAEENIDIESMRINFNKKFSNVINKETCTENFDSLRYIEMAIDNICNLQCKICDSKRSSRLQARDKFLGIKVYKKLEPNYHKFDNIDISKVARVKILGGEPFMSPNFIKFIDYIIKRANPKDITIEISTNGTSVPDKEIIEKLNLFKNLNIAVSLDSFDKSNDYQRVGGSYIETFNNALLYRNIFKNSHVYTHSVITLLNANKLGDTMNELGKHFNTSIDFVKWPNHLSIFHAPKEYLDWIIESNSHNDKAINMIKNFIKNSKYDEELWKKFLESISTLDDYYDTKLKNFNEPLANFLLDFK